MRRLIIERRAATGGLTWLGRRVLIPSRDVVISRLPSLFERSTPQMRTRRGNRRGYQPPAPAPRPRPRPSRRRARPLGARKFRRLSPCCQVSPSTIPACRSCWRVVTWGACYRRAESVASARRGLACLGRLFFSPYSKNIPPAYSR